MRLLRRTLIALVMGLMVGLTAPGVASAADYFLKLDGIRGESRDREFQDAIDVISWSWGVSTPRNGRAEPQDFSVTKAVDAASPLLFEHVASGRMVPTATFYVRTTGAQPHRLLTYCFTGVRVTSIQTGTAGGGEDRPQDRVTLAYETVVEAYRPQRADGSAGVPIFGGWDFIRNVRLSVSNC